MARARQSDEILPHVIAAYDAKANFNKEMKFKQSVMLGSCEHITKKAFRVPSGTLRQP